MQGASIEHREDHGVLSRRPGRPDAGVGGILGERQNLRTIAEQGRAPLPEVEAPGVDLGEVCHEGCRGLSLAPGEAPRPGEQLVVVEVCKQGEEICWHDNPPILSVHVERRDPYNH
jgi:hypothetical protein